MSSAWEPEAGSGPVIARLRSVDPAKAPSKASAPAGLRDLVRMMFAGLFLGALFLAGTLGLPRLGWQRPPPVENRPPPNPDPYAEARLSREILDLQSGPPATHRALAGASDRRPRRASRD
jgi:hypothetical protein